jgi:penicillin-binding protein 2
MLMRKDKYEDRKFIIAIVIAIIGLIYLLKIASLQLWDEKYKYAAENNSRRDVTIYPPRGLIYDRQDKIVVYNEAVFDLMITPIEVKNIDTNKLCNLLDISKEEFINKITEAKHYSYHKSSVFISQISKKDIAYIQENFYLFSGFHVQARKVRKYPFASAAHLLGYIGEVNREKVESDPYYKSGDYIGISGIEKIYEKELRGTKGVKKLLVDKHNQIVGSLANGELDLSAIEGKNLYTGLDISLQEYGELLMQNKKGAIVAIEPYSGEILAMISSPTYDPNMLVGRERSVNYVKLVKDSVKPLLNRALISSYPPGSTFKIVNALIAMQEGQAFENTHYACNNGFHAGGLHVGCHNHKSPLNLKESIQHSCNAYYCYVFKSIIENSKYENSEYGFNVWRKYVLNLGFGVKYGVDLPSEKTGNIPKASYYDKFYGRHRWNYLTIISLSIGQGEILATPLQLANQAATIANRGYFITPHIVRAIGTKDSLNSDYTEKHLSGIDKKHFDLVADAMEDVVNSGTARLARVDSISVCGKTGTVQNPHGENHSVFIAFAPKDNPKIAIATFVENSGYGGTWAAPISSLMIEKYIKGYINPKRLWLEKRMLEGDLMNVKPKNQ